VLDNLNTHVGGSLYEAFPPAEARRILSRLEIHYFLLLRGGVLQVAEGVLEAPLRIVATRRSQLDAMRTPRTRARYALRRGEVRTPKGSPNAGGVVSTTASSAAR